MLSEIVVEVMVVVLLPEMRRPPPCQIRTLGHFLEPYPIGSMGCSGSEVEAHTEDAVLPEISVDWMVTVPPSM